MPCTNLLTTVLAESSRLMLKEAGPAIFVHCHLVILPSGSYEAVPLSNTLSIGKVTSWSGPATAMGSWLPVLHPSQESSFWQDGAMVAVIDNTINVVNNVHFIAI